MALASPGVEVDIINESVYGPTAVATVPLVFIATATDKLTADSTATAAGTVAANANQLYLASSQRDLVNQYGVPTFYKDSNGTPLHGYEINEYGLMAAYSALGVSNRIYVVRADVDLSQLVGTSVRPTDPPADGTIWFDLADTSWGVFEWDESTGTFSNVTDILVITDLTQTQSAGGVYPLSSLGTIGQYAVTMKSNGVWFLTYKDYNGVWNKVGSTSSTSVGEEWQWAHPTVQGTATNPTLTPADGFYVNQTHVTGATTIDDVVSQLIAPAVAGVTAYNNQGRLEIFANNNAAGADGSTVDGTLVITAGTGTILADLGLTAGTYYPPTFVFAPHTSVPAWRSTDSTPRPSGSVWIKTTTPNYGADYIVKKYNSLTETWSTVAAPLYYDDAAANYGLDSSGGGTNIAEGSLFARYDVLQDSTATWKIYERTATGEVSVTGATTSPTLTVSDSFTIEVTTAGSATYGTAVTVVLSGTTADSFVGDINAKGIDGLYAQVETSGAITISLSYGGSVRLTDVTGTPVEDAGFNTIGGVTPTGLRLVSATQKILTHWQTPDGTQTTDILSVGSSTPSVDPADGTYWYYSSVDDVDIMINDGTAWVGYQKSATADPRGYDLTTCDPNGPIIAATEPTTQSDSTALVYGDLWVDTSDLENYPMLYRWQSVSGTDQWVLMDNSDQTTENGILFADARWSADGTVDPVTDDLPLVTDLLTSDYLDVDAPDPALYPKGTLLWNTRRSSYNVKKFESDYLTAVNFGNTIPSYITNSTGAHYSSYPTGNVAGGDGRPLGAWVNASGNKTDGSPYMGRKAARIIVVGALKSAINTNNDIREEQYQYNLIACPGYPEVAAEMTALNNDKRNTAFIIADTPFRLAANGTAIQNWANGDDEDSITTADPYTAVYYPSGWSTNSFTDGNTDILVPPSHMAMRVILRNDNVAYPWFAPAGTRRGAVDNATKIGYIDSSTGEVQFTGIMESLRDTLYESKINPFTLLPGQGLVAYGQKTLDPNSTAMDRVNVSRLVVYLRGRLQQAVKPFLFEPNDKITRDEALQVVNSILNDLVAKRGVYDYIAICDDTNNTPDRIDRNELWIDVGIEPEKAIEFIYVPVRILNTGAISQVGK